MGMSTQTNAAQKIVERVEENIGERTWEDGRLIIVLLRSQPCMLMNVKDARELNLNPKTKTQTPQDPGCWGA